MCRRPACAGSPHLSVAFGDGGVQGVKLFDIRTDDSHAGFIAAVNRGLDSEPDNPYLSRFGHVCSPRWWACFDRGELPVAVLAGPGTPVGARPAAWSDEPEDVDELRCGEEN